MSTPTLETLKAAIAVKEQIAALERKLAALLGGSSLAVVKAPAPAIKGRRKMSAAAKAKIGAAVKARWAKAKATAPSAKPVAAKSAPAAKPAKKKGGLTEEGRKKLAAAMKARWAARKKAGAPALNATKK
jgi:hypothetical protein